MIIKNKEKLKNNLVTIGLISLIIGEMIFYRMETKNIYLFFNLVGIFIISLTLKIKFNKKDGFVLWFTFINLMFNFYGLFFLRKGIYNFDVVIFHYFIILYIYIGFNNLLKKNKLENFFNVFIYSFIFVILFILINETNILFSDKEIMFGDSIAGNRNTVALFLGTELTMFLYGYFVTQKKKFLFLMFLSSLFIMLTGSKKGIIIILINGLFYFSKVRKNKKNIIFFIILIFIFFYLIFFNDYFYNVIGNRIIGMISTLKGDHKVYSHSTESRKFMIKEGWKFFLETPIFGGGYNNFYSKTTTLYDYSHCNYIELLCSFGLFGTILYYFQYLKIFFISIKKIIKRKVSIENELILVLCFQTLLLDLFNVSFSGFAIFYLPIVLISILSMKIEEKKF